MRLEGLLSQTRALTSMFKEAEKDETEVSGRALTHGRKTFTSKTWWSCKQEMKICNWFICVCNIYVTDLPYSVLGTDHFI